MQKQIPPTSFHVASSLLKLSFDSTESEIIRDFYLNP